MDGIGHMTENEQEWFEERAAIAEFEALRGTKPGGPFIPLIRAPEVLRFANQMGNYLRFNTEFPMALSELAILITARRWSQNYEWIAHRKIAEEAGQERKVYAPEAVEMLVTAEWPGNIRQLFNVVRQNVALSRSPVISANRPAGTR